MAPQVSKRSSEGKEQFVTARTNQRNSAKSSSRHGVSKSSPGSGGSGSSIGDMARGQFLPPRLPRPGAAGRPGDKKDNANLIARLASAAADNIIKVADSLKIHSNPANDNDFLQFFKIDADDIKAAGGGGEKVGKSGAAPTKPPPTQRPREWTISIPASAEVNTQNASRLANLRHPEGNHIPDLTGEHQPPNRDRRCNSLDIQYEKEGNLQRQYKDWVNSADKWKDGLGKGWVGERYLGRGGMGITGLWRFEGFEGDENHKWEKQVKRIVVKQMRTGLDDGLRYEAEYHKRMSDSKSKHFPTFYRRCYRDVGSGVKGMRLDASRREVNRIFMEYCEGGDVDQVITKLQHLYREAENENEEKECFMREDQVWAIFRCLVMALKVLDHGREQGGKSPDYTHPPLVHLDIKPQNCFIARKEATGRDHDRIPIHKIGDFGIAFEEPETQDSNFTSRYRRCGTQFSLAPEQILQPADPDNLKEPIGSTKVQRLTEPDIRFGSHTNVYQAGLVIYMLMTLNLYMYPLAEPVRATFVPALQKSYSLAVDLVHGMYHPEVDRTYLEGAIEPSNTLPTNRRKVPYSDELRALVMECMMIKYKLRPRIEELDRRVYLGYQRARNAYPDPVPEAKDPFSNLAAEPKHDYPVPAFWAAQDEPRDYWIPAPYGRGHLYELLPELEQHLHNDRLRLVQKFKAMQKKKIPMTFVQEELFPRMKLELNETARRKRNVEVLDLDEPGQPKRRRTHKLDLTLHIFEPVTEGGVRRVTKQFVVAADTTIIELKRLLDKSTPRLVPFKIDNMRIDQYADDFGELDYPETDIKDSELIVDYLPERWVHEQKMVKIRGILEINQRKRKLLGPDGIETDDPQPQLLHGKSEELSKSEERRAELRKLDALLEEADNAWSDDDPL